MKNRTSSNVHHHSYNSAFSANSGTAEQSDAQRPQPGTLHIKTKGPDGIRIPVLSSALWERLLHASGPIPATLTNDRLFRGICSYSLSIRRTLAAILLGMNDDQISSATIMNPISFGQTARGKRTEQDVRLLVNEEILIDIEVQNLFLDSNNRRFLLYLCRNYDTVRAGEEYNNLKSNLLIGIMNYPFDRKMPEFYAQYRLINTRTMRPLFPDEKDFFGFNIMDLTQSGLADESDHTSGRILLARLLKATTWEELQVLCRESGFAKEVAGYMYASNMDLKEWVALDEARRDAEQQAYRETQARKIAEGRKEISKGRKEISKGRKEITKGRKEIARGRKELATRQRELADNRKQLANEQKELANGQKQLANGQKQLANGQKQLANGQKQLADSRNRLDNDRKALEQDRNKLNGDMREFAALREDIAGKKQQIDEKEKEYANKDRMYAAQQETLQQTREENTRILKRLAELELRYAELQKSKSSSQNEN